MKHLIVDVMEKKQYQFICLVANQPYRDIIGNVLINNSFNFDMEQKNNIKFNFLVIIESRVKNEFIDMCSKNDIGFRFYDELIPEYERYVDMKVNEKESLSKNDFDNVQVYEVVTEKEIEPIICGEGTTRILLEKTIEKTAKLKIWIGSNERTGHHLPHVHADYDNEKYAVFNLIDLSVIDSRAKTGLNAKTKELKELIEQNIIKAREIWNQTNALLKFPTITDQIPYTPQLIKEKG